MLTLSRKLSLQVLQICAIDSCKTLCVVPQGPMDSTSPLQKLWNFSVGVKTLGKFSKKEAQVIKSHLTLWDLPHPIYKALPILKRKVNVTMNLNIHLDHKAMEGRRVLTLNR